VKEDHSRIKLAAVAIRSFAKTFI